jgi:hypothetical protein
VIEAIPVLCEQGRLDAAEAMIVDNEWQRASEDAQLVAGLANVESRLLRARKRPAEALGAAERAFPYRSTLGITNLYVKRAFVEAVEAAFELDDLTRVDELLAGIDALQPGERTPSLEAQRARFRARLDTRRDDHDGVDRAFRTAGTLFAEHGMAFYVAVTRLEHAEWLADRGRADDAAPLLAAARETFERLEAKPWLERLDALAIAPAAIPA